MSELFLIRARLKDSLELRTLAPMLLPDNENDRVGAEHRLVWSLMAETPDQTRDFLYRVEAPGKFLILAPRRPRASALFDTDEPKSFAPALAVGDRLGFALRANATASVNRGADQRGKRRDVVSRALAEVTCEQRAEQRATVIGREGGAWLQRQGARHGFAVAPGLLVEEQEPLSLPRRGNRPARLGRLEFSGSLTVNNPAGFVAALAQGFGRGKAFGLGLMLIRRI